LGRSATEKKEKENHINKPKATIVSCASKTDYSYFNGTASNVRGLRTNDK
jgi:hypothetical protein